MERETLNVEQIQTMQPHQLIDFAIESINTVQEKGIAINMVNFFGYEDDSETGKICTVCLAGAVLYNIGCRTREDICKKPLNKLAFMFDMLRIKQAAKVREQMEEILFQPIDELEANVLLLRHNYYSHNDLSKERVDRLIKDLKEVSDRLKMIKY